MDTTEIPNTLESLFEKTTTYVETNIELSKLKAIKKGSILGASLISNSIVGLFFGMAIMVLNIAVGLWLGSVLGKSYYGFFVLAIFYSLIGVVLYLYNHKWIKEPLTNSFIKKLNE